MQVTIDLSREYFDALLSHVPKESRQFTTLMGAVIHRQSESLLPTDSVMIVCQDCEAMALLDIAKECCAEAASAIDEALKHPKSP